MAQKFVDREGELHYITGFTFVPEGNGMTGGIYGIEFSPRSFGCDLVYAQNLKPVLGDDPWMPRKKTQQPARKRKEQPKGLLSKHVFDPLEKAVGGLFS